MKKIRIIKFAILISVYTVFSEYYFENGKKVELSLKNRNVKGAALYLTQTGRTVKASNRIIVKYKNKNDAISSLNNYPVTVVDSTVDNFFLLEVMNADNLFEISRQLYHDSSFQFAHPDLIRERRMR